MDKEAILKASCNSTPQCSTQFFTAFIIVREDPDKVPSGIIKIWESLSSLISKLDSYLFNSENLTSNNLDPYLPSVLAKELGKHDSLKKFYKVDLLHYIVTVI